MLKLKLFSAFAGLAMLASVGAASAAEPVMLSDAQMDGVVAGQTVNFGIGQFGLVNAAVLAAVIGVVSTQ